MGTSGDSDIALNSTYSDPNATWTLLKTQLQEYHECNPNPRMLTGSLIVNLTS